MSASFNRCSLYLCPKQHDFSVSDYPAFINALQQIGFINNNIENKINSAETGKAYFTGDKFLKLIAYMGCAPAIKFEPDEDNAHFCFINIHNLETAQLIHSQLQAKAPHCPHCKKPVKNWQQTKTSTQIFCAQCQTSAHISTLNWRKMAGYAQFFIEITDIFPKEAIPQPSLLDKLANITSVDWQYFYSCK